MGIKDIIINDLFEVSNFLLNFGISNINKGRQDHIIQKIILKISNNENVFKRTSSYVLSKYAEWTGWLLNPKKGKERNGFPDLK